MAYLDGLLGLCLLGSRRDLGHRRHRAQQVGELSREDRRHGQAVGFNFRNVAQLCCEYSHGPNRRQKRYGKRRSGPGPYLARVARTAAVVNRPMNRLAACLSATSAETDPS